MRPIARRSTVDQVVDRIRDVIEGHKLAPGMRLPGEHQLVEQLQVSRPVLREALARLQSLGLVDIQRGRGTFVGSADSLANCVQLLRTALIVSPRELLDYAEVRTAIEVQAARLAAERATAEEIEQLERILDELNREDRPYPEHLEIDFQFHRKLIEIARNPLMQNMMEVIYEFVLAQMARTTPSQNENQLGRQLHHDIVAAVKSHDANAAERAMRVHMQAVLDRLKSAADDTPSETPATMSASETESRETPRATDRSEVDHADDNLRQ
ncbi:MAG TPA: FadR/GntR family transcriptional regulator [Pirellulales bacterium]